MRLLFLSRGAAAFLGLVFGCTLTAWDYAPAGVLPELPSFWAAIPPLQGHTAPGIFYILIPTLNRVSLMPKYLREFLLLIFKLAQGIVEFIFIDTITKLSNPEGHQPQVHRVPQAQEVSKRTRIGMFYATLKEDTNNARVERAYGAGWFLVDSFLRGTAFFSLQLALYKLKLQNLKIRQEQPTSEKGQIFPEKPQLTAAS